MRPIARLIRGIDRFLLLLTATVLLASLLPARGIGVPIFAWLTDIAIVLLFFLHGAKLSRAAILGGLGKWRLHLLVLACSFLFFPLLGLGIAGAADRIVSPEILSGVLFLTFLPSTVQSSIAFTSIAGGDVPAAVCSASLSNIVGIFVTPVLVGLLLHIEGSVGGISGEAILGIVLQLLLPFTLGHLSRPLTAGFIHRHGRWLAPVDRGSILLVVYSAFSAAVVNGIWQRTDLIDLVWILLICIALLAVVMGSNRLLARALGLPREEEIVLLFCGSKKSIASGVPIAGALFSAAQVGVIILPLMIFHQLQLFVCAVIAARYRRTAEAAKN